MVLWQHARTHARTHKHTHQIKYLLRFKHFLLSSFRFKYCDTNRFTSTCTMSTQLIFTDPKLAKLEDKINKLLRNRKSINEVQFSWCVIMNVGTQVGTKSVKNNVPWSCILRKPAPCGYLHKCNIHSNSTGHLEEQIYF